MKIRSIIPAVLLTMTIATAAVASDEAPKGVDARGTDHDAVDCTKEVWPNIPTSCLRNADLTVQVRVVTANRR